MASLMPLRKSITPWKVGFRSSAVWARLGGASCPGSGGGRTWEQRREEVIVLESPGSRPSPHLPLSLTGRSNGATQRSSGPPIWDLSQQDGGIRRVSECRAWEAVPSWHQGSSGPCLRPLPRSGPSTRRTSCAAWNRRGPSLPASSRVTGWVSTGGWMPVQDLGSCCWWVHSAHAQPVTESAPRPLPLTHRRFFKSPHFDGWYRQRRKEMAHQLEALHLEAICEAVRGAGGPGAEGLGLGRVW